MIRQALRRLLDIVVLFFAGLGFFYVPLGQQTGYQHCRHLWTTGAASSLEAELGKTLAFVRDHLQALPALPPVPDLPAPSASASGSAPSKAAPKGSGTASLIRVK